VIEKNINERESVKKIDQKVNKNTKSSSKKSKMDYESVTKRSVNSLVSFDSDSSNYQNGSNKIVFKGL
jgi:hypothetical protein